ncbi:MAG: collagen-like protein, partial [Nitrosopumilaceae archaeon]
MSGGSSRKIEIEGVSPFKLPSGVFEVQIALCESPPTEQEITKKSFQFIWKDNFHLRVKDKKFSLALGSDKNPLPDYIFDRNSIWVVITDQFSSTHAVFENAISSARLKKVEAQVRETPVSKETFGHPLQGRSGPVGPPGPPGPRGPMGPSGPIGDK